MSNTCAQVNATQAYHPSGHFGPKRPKHRLASLHWWERNPSHFEWRQWREAGRASELGKADWCAGQVVQAEHPVCGIGSFAQQGENLGINFQHLLRCMRRKGGMHPPECEQFAETAKHPGT